MDSDAKTSYSRTAQNPHKAQSSLPRRGEAAASRQETWHRGGAAGLQSWSNAKCRVYAPLQQEQCLQ